MAVNWDHQERENDTHIFFLSIQSSETGTC